MLHTHSRTLVALPSLRADIDASVRNDYAVSGIVDVSRLAESVRKRHPEANIAREDVEHLAMEICGLISAPMLLFSVVEDDVIPEVASETFAAAS